MVTTPAKVALAVLGTGTAGIGGWVVYEGVFNGKALDNKKDSPQAAENKEVKSKKEAEGSIEKQPTGAKPSSATLEDKSNDESEKTAVPNGGTLNVEGEGSTDVNETTGNTESVPDPQIAQETDTNLESGNQEKTKDSQE